MPFMLTRVEVQDFDQWKPRFDAARETIRAEAKSHRIMRSVEDPHEVFIQVEFETADAADAARRLLLDGGQPEGVTIKNGPTITEPVEQVDY